MSDSGTTPTDIITYIGVPLAVLGVLPILYNTIVTLAALSRIKRMLRHSRLTALTRSDVVNRVIEVELPRYAVTPWDRNQQRDEYWSLARHPSMIPGGTWTTFNWKTNTIGIKTQRVEYADQLRQPQVDVSFDELVCYLLDLGAVPDVHGWRLLRSTGLWTPVGCSLMQSPDGQHKALSVAPLDDSDGHLSLAVNWSSHWTTRSHASLPPYWVRLPAPPAVVKEEENTGEGSSTINEEVEETTQELKKDGTSTRKTSLDTVQQQVESNSRKAITCKVSGYGIISALPQEEGRPASSHPDSLYIEHVRIRQGRQDGVWFASAITAYGTSSQTILWNYRIPDEILAFTRKDSVPCGVLEMLNVVDDSMTPEWSTKNDAMAENMNLHMKRMREQRTAMQQESRMAPAQREQAVRDRMRRESEQRLDDMGDKMRQDAQRREARALEALQSPKWDSKLVAEQNLRWLKKHSHINEMLTLKEAVGTILHRMVLEGEFTTQICGMLDMWKVWADNNGMRKSDLVALQDGQVTFALASLLVAVIKESSGTLEGTMSMDLQECLRMWSKVRLG